MPKKPAEPHRDFPLYPHSSRQWAKKIMGRTHYFGSWADPQAALELYFQQKDDLIAGRTPSNGQGLTVKQLVNRFLNSKKRLVLLLPNSYEGDTVIDEGTLILGQSEVLFDTTDLIINGGSLDLGSPMETIRSLKLDGGVIQRNSVSSTTLAMATTAAALTLRNGADLDDANISLSLTSSEGGHISVGGTLGAGISSTTATPVNLGSASRVFNIGDINTTGDDLIWDGVVSGTGGINKLGAGTLTLTNSNSYSGDTNVSAGELLLKNTSGSSTGTGGVTVNSGATLGGTCNSSGSIFVEAGGTVAPGTSAGEFSVGRVTFQMDSILEIELGGTASSQFDVLDVTGTATLAGILDVTLINVGGGLYSPELNDTFTILSASTVGGVFATTADELPLLDEGLAWQINYGLSNVVLEVIADVFPGDYNDDGTVNAADYVVWRDNLDSTVTLPGDTTPGMVTQGDYNVWAMNFGNSLASAAGAAVPEPATWVISTAATLVVFLCCRRL